MPTYALECQRCGYVFARWQSIHDDTLPACDLCGGPTKRVIHSAPIHGFKVSVLTIDAREKRWDRDLPAYVRLRMEGHQPPQIDGARDLEQHANDPWYIKSGGAFNIPEHRTSEINEMLAEGEANPAGWSPIDTVKERRATGKR